VPIMRTDFDYYAVLGVPSSATASELKQAYHLLVKLYHPDTNPGEEEECTQRMQLVNEAFRVLNNARERAKYDLTRNAVEAEAPKRSHEARRPEPQYYPPPTFRPYGPPKVTPPYDQVPKSRLREGVIAVTAAVVLIGGLGLAAYNVVAPSLAKSPATTSPAVVSEPPPVTIVHEAEPVRAVTSTPKRSVDRTEDVPVRYTHIRTTHHVRRTGSGLTPAQKDARAAALASRIETAKRAAHPADDLYR